MNVIPDNIRSQLAPGWSGVNIAIMVVLLIFLFPLGVLMIGYILLGESLGVDLGRPETFTTLFRRIGRAFDAGMTEFNGQANRAPAVNTDPTTAQADAAPAQPVDATSPQAQDIREAQEQREQREQRDVLAQRETLDADRRRFEAEKAAFYQRRDRDSQGGQES